MTVSFPFQHILTPHSTICSSSSPSTGSSARATPIYSGFACVIYIFKTISSIITTAPPDLLFLTPITCCCCCCPSCNTTCTQHLSSRVIPLAVDSLCLIMALDQNMKIFLFLCQWQILIQTMNPLWMYDLLHLNYLLMADHQGDDQRDKQGGCQGGKVKAIHWYNCTCILHLNVPVFHTIMYGHPIGHQYSWILFAPSTMLNTG